MALELFGEDFKNELLEELVQLNVKAMTEAKLRVSRGTNWASIKDVQEKTGWGRKKIEDFRDAGKFRYQQNAKSIRKATVLFFSRTYA